MSKKSVFDSIQNYYDDEQEEEDYEDEGQEQVIDSDSSGTYSDLDLKLSELQQPRTLQTIIELAEESQQSMQRDVEAEQNQNLQYLLCDDSYSIPIMIIDDDKKLQTQTKPKQTQLMGFRALMKLKEEEKKQFEKQFNRLVHEQAKYLVKQQKEEQILKKLEKTIKPSKLQETVHELLKYEFPQQNTKEVQLPVKQQKQRPKRQEDGEQQQLIRQIESLKYELEHMKQQSNEDQEIIKTLKMQVKKMDSCSTSASSISIKTDQLAEDNEKLKFEIVQMKLLHTQEKDALKHQLQRANRVQSAISQNKQKSVPQNDPLQQENEKLKAEITALACQFRNRQKEQQDKLDNLQKVLKEKDLEIASLRDQIDQPTKLKTCIKEQKEVIEQLKQQNQKIRSNYSLDNQIYLLFPKRHKSILFLMNQFNRLENLESGQDVCSVMFRSASKQITNIIQICFNGLKWIGQYIVYILSRNPIKHPSNQQLVQAALVKIRAAPTVLEREIIQCKKQLNQIFEENNQLKIENKQLSTQLTLKSDQLKVAEELLQVDKIQVANTIMTKILKKEADDRKQQQTEIIPELNILKGYCDIIYQSSLVVEKQILLQQQQMDKQKDKQVIVQPKAKCSQELRHKRREAVPLKSQYYNK